MGKKVSTHCWGIISKKNPAVFPFGMGFKGGIKKERKKDILILPLAAVRKDSKDSKDSKGSKGSRGSKESTGSEESKDKKESINSGESYVMVKREGVLEPEKVIVKTGLADNLNIEIVSGVGTDDKIIIESKKFSLSDKAGAANNPFMPSRPAGASGRGR